MMPLLRIGEVPAHPDKAIEAALRALEARGWTIEKAKGRSAHAWGLRAVSGQCRGGVPGRGVLPDVGLEQEPRNPAAHARALMRQAEECVMGMGEDDDA